MNKIVGWDCKEKRLKASQPEHALKFRTVKKPRRPKNEIISSLVSVFISLVRVDNTLQMRSKWHYQNNQDYKTTTKILLVSQSQSDARAEDFVVKTPRPAKN
jgi:hypothetical protein